MFGLVPVLWKYICVIPGVLWDVCISHWIWIYLSAEKKVQVHAMGLAKLLHWYLNWTEAFQRAVICEINVCAWLALRANCIGPVCMLCHFAYMSVRSWHCHSVFAIGAWVVAHRTSHVAYHWTSIRSTVTVAASSGTHILSCICSYATLFSKKYDRWINFLLWRFAVLSKALPLLTSLIWCRTILPLTCYL